MAGPQRYPTLALLGLAGPPATVLARGGFRIRATLRPCVSSWDPAPSCAQVINSLWIKAGNCTQARAESWRISTSSAKKSRRASARIFFLRFLRLAVDENLLSGPETAADLSGTNPNDNLRRYSPGNVSGLIEGDRLDDIAGDHTSRFKILMKYR